MDMKRLMTFALLCLGAMAASCSKSDLQMEQEDQSTAETVGHEMIVLGRQLEDPYSVKNITKALQSLNPTRADRVDVTPTNKYVRFLPKTDEEYTRLLDLGLDLIDHPLDYQVLKDGDYYHDPEIDEDSITWQYAVVDKDFEAPEGIRYEVLDDCYIPDNAADTKADGIDWAEVEREAFRLTGNEDLLEPRTRSKEKPAGRITIVDENANGGKPFGVAGVKVVCNVFVKFASSYTDRDGYYKISKKYSSKVRYRLLFKNKKGFNIGFNKIIVPSSMSTLGKGSSSGLDYTVTKNSEKKLYTRCVVNNAAYDYYSRCSSDDMDIKTPPKGLRIWIFYNIRPSSAVMIKHGAIIDNNLFSKFIGQYAGIIKTFMPDITIGAKGKKDYGTLYSETCHELAHASHFAVVGKSFWDKYILYISSSFITSGGETYGNGSGSGAGYCEVGEMWGYFMQNKMYNDRYGGEMPVAGTNYWFHPQILRYLYERGVSASQIFAALTSDVKSGGDLKKKLIELYPEKKSIIEQVFERYGN